MTRPRCILPGSTYLITKKCVLDLFRIRPEPVVNEILLYCLLISAQRTGVLLHGFCFLSNHWHGIVTDPEARLPEFMKLFGTLSSKAINAHHGEFGPLWSADKYVATRLYQLEDAIDKLVYTLANPVNAELVEEPEDWPGVTSAIYDWEEDIVIERPESFFSTSEKFPDEVSRELTPLSHAYGEFVPEGELEDEIESELREYVETIQDRVRGSRRRFLGVRKVRTTPRESRPAAPRQRSQLKPRIACKDEELRKLAIDELKAFEDAYARALHAFRRGNRNVKFPPGTYALRVHLCLNCGYARAA